MSAVNTATAWGNAAKQRHKREGVLKGSDAPFSPKPSHFTTKIVDTVSLFRHQTILSKKVGVLSFLVPVSHLAPLLLQSLPVL